MRSRVPSSMADDTVEVFVYTGVGEGAVAPKGVVRVRVDPSVLAIPERAFARLALLEEVQLSDGSGALGMPHFPVAESLLNSDVLHSLP